MIEKLPYIRSDPRDVSAADHHALAALVEGVSLKTRIGKMVVVVGG